MDLHQTAREIREAMVGLGVHLRQDWIKHCLQAGDGRRRQQSEAQEGVYRTFLACDLREAGEACLPPGIAGMVKERVKGKMVVQVENAKDIAKNFEQREKTDGASAHHTLKLALGDGRQTVAAFEYRRIEGLVADPPPGLKLLLVEPWVRRGILLLSSENTTVLGGEVSSLVEERDTARAGGERNRAGPTANTTDSTRQQQNRNRAGDGTSSNGANGDEGSGAPAAPRNASTAASQRTSGSNNRGGDNARSRPPAPTPGDRTSQARRRGQDENADPDDAVVDLSPLSSPSRGRRNNDDEGLGRHQQQRQQQQQQQQQQRSTTGSRGGRRDGSSDDGQARAGTGVSNPYTRVTQPAAPTPRPAAIGTTADASRNGRQQGQGVEADTQHSRRPPRGNEVRVPAFPDMDDDGPGFEYLEEPEFDDKEEQPPDEVEQHENPGMRSERPLVSPSPKSTARDPSPSPPPVTPRPTIVSARVQRERQEREQEARKRRRAAAAGGERGGGRVGVGGEVADIEGEFGRGSREGRGGGSGVPPRKRGCSSTFSKGKQLGIRGQSDGLQHDSASLSPLPSGPFTSLEDLGRLAAVGGGVYRVKAVVSDARNCKIRKKKYLLVVEIEDGTAVASVRLCDQITKRLFGVEAREFKKLFQADPDLASEIQRRVEKEIREMEGVMEIDISSAAGGSQQSPAASGTPSTAASQSSATGDAEWLLPVVMSVKPPTDGDCRGLLARVRSSLSL